MRTYFLTLLLLWATPLWAAQSVPVKITSDSMQYTQKEDQVVFSGAVHVIRQDIELWSETLTVHLDRKQKSGKSEQVIDEQGSIKKIVAQGNVRIKADKGRSGTCGRAVYDAAGWRLRAEQLGALVIVVALLLLIGAWFARRQVLKMLAMTNELAASHEQLAGRIKEATNELAAQKDEAERANRAKSRFLAAASHDLRQPMHALALFAADLQRQVHLGKTDQLEHLSGQIAASIRLLGEMLDSLLDISRLDVAGVNPEIRAFALQPLFERIAAAFRRSAADRSQTLVFRPSGLWVESDSQIVERMLTNLLSNALRYTPNGGRILVAARRRGPDVLIEVRDNGRGIASEDQAAIFTEFYQVGNPAREPSKGLGLGLSIIDRLARALNIEVRLRSASGRGTVFGLLLKSRPDAGTVAPASVGNAVAIHFIGAGDALQAAMGLVRSWDYAVSWQPSGAVPLAEFQCPMIVVTLASLAGAVRASVPPTTPMITLVDLPETAVPDGAFPLALPLRPAKLRALLGQIQKTLPNSMP